MRSAKLLAVATAHGIDLTHVGGIESRTDGPARLRRRTQQELEQGIDLAPNAQGRGTRVYRRPEWSLAELGMAAKGLEELPWYAARYSYAGDPTCYWPLWYALLYHAQRIAGRENWPPRVMGRQPRDVRTGKPIAGARGSPRFYLSELAMLVLDEDAHRNDFRTRPELFASYMGVEPETWDRTLEPRYRAVQARYERWLRIATSKIQRWLMEPQPEDVDEVR